MDKEDVIWMVKDHVRNYFNERNSPDLEPADTPRFRRFLRMCDRIHGDIESGKFKPSPYESESVVGLHKYTIAKGPDGKPWNILQAYSVELKSYCENMFSGM